MASTFKTLSKIGLAGLLGAVAYGGAAFADGPINAEMTVSFDRAELASSSGAEAFYTSLQTDVRRLCRRAVRQDGIYTPEASRACARKTLAKAVDMIDAPLLRAMHRGEPTKARFAATKARVRT